ncbi:MAG: c-type cytochrome, partial [Terriglobales bacterium]
MLSVAVFLAACRQDMHDQPKYIPLRASDFFRDGRSARVPVEGTVARGHLRDDEHFYTGKVNGVLAETLPFSATRAVLERGQERYNIYCAPCHSRLGDGNGAIVQRGY